MSPPVFRNEKGVPDRRLTSPTQIDSDDYTITATTKLSPLRAIRCMRCGKYDLTLQYEFWHCLDNALFVCSRRCRWAS